MPHPSPSGRAHALSRPRARRRLCRALLVVAPTLASCGDGGTGPTGGEANGFMTARIDGSAWASDPIYVDQGAQVTGSGIYVIQGTQVSGTEALAIVLSLMNVPGPGTYPLGTGGGVSGGTGIVALGGSGWTTPLSGAAGTITIAEVGDTRITGSFSFTADASTGGASGTRAVTQGEFDLPLRRVGTVQPVPETSMNHVGATVGGEAWSAATITLQPNPATLWGFSAGNDRHMITIAVQDVAGPGTYALSSVAPLRLAEVYGPGGPLDTSEDCCWTSALGGATGSVTIDTWTGTRATGSFSFTLPAKSGTVATGPITVSAGTFDVGIPE